ncbi:hypothetical protein [Paenibacillus silvae]|uniref:hypothetical protein n=1 Tax=Paenibacillus silvae TaxID=1325358 RepID=UPI003570E73F
MTKNRYKVLKGPLAVRTRELIRQGCEARGIAKLQGKCGQGTYSSVVIQSTEFGTK